eukprot:8919207-Karenia_brevis.AAC.1
MELKARAGMVARIPNVQIPISCRQLQVNLDLGFQSFDRLLHMLQYADEEVLSDFVADPKSWIEHRAETAIIMSDAAPVYLNLGGSKKLIS